MNWRDVSKTERPVAPSDYMQIVVSIRRDKMNEYVNLTNLLKSLNNTPGYLRDEQFEQFKHRIETRLDIITKEVTERVLQGRI